MANLNLYQSPDGTKEYVVIETDTDEVKEVTEGLELTAFVPLDVEDDLIVWPTNRLLRQE